MSRTKKQKAAIKRKPAVKPKAKSEVAHAEASSLAAPESPPAVTSVSSAKPKAYAFPTKSRCPRCRGLQTRCYSTQGRVQYRRCLAPVCQKAYTVMGTKV